MVTGVWVAGRAVRRAAPRSRAASISRDGNQVAPGPCHGLHAGNSAAAGIPSAAIHIGEVAQRTELAPRTLRRYDEDGLLPSGRTVGGCPLYEGGPTSRSSCSSA